MDTSGVGAVVSGSELAGSEAGTLTICSDGYFSSGASSDIRDDLVTFDTLDPDAGWQSDSSCDLASTSVLSLKLCMPPATPASVTSSRFLVTEGPAYTVHSNFEFGLSVTHL